MESSLSNENAQVLHRFGQWNVDIYCISVVYIVRCDKRENTGRKAGHSLQELHDEGRRTHADVHLIEADPASLVVHHSYVMRAGNHGSSIKTMTCPQWSAHKSNRLIHKSKQVKMNANYYGLDKTMCKFSANFAFGKNDERTNRYKTRSVVNTYLNVTFQNLLCVLIGFLER